MDKKEFEKTLKDLMTKKGDMIAKFYKTKSKDKKTVFLLKLLWYNTNFINILTIWKDLNYIENETANKFIAKAIETNRETYKQLTLLKQ